VNSNSHPNRDWNPVWTGLIPAVSALRLSIVVPTFNESDNVLEFLRCLDSTLGSTGWEVIFVDDDSPDGTATLVREIARIDLEPRPVTIHNDIGLEMYQLIAELYSICRSITAMGFGRRCASSQSTCFRPAPKCSTGPCPDYTA
jgi:cellulose synthase/poly-beta-1,6-N-acetylglucosamine synthase-like glycosyltransferase